MYEMRSVRGATYTTPTYTYVGVRVITNLVQRIIVGPLSVDTTRASRCHRKKKSQADEMSCVHSTRLKVNYHKSNIYPINVPEAKMEILANTFQCKIRSYPFTYLGLPMGLTKPKLESFLPLVQKIERRLSSTSQFLSLAGRLQMVNTLFSSLSIIICAL